MKPPLFVIEGLDISAYESAEALESHLEPFFVKEADYVAYDSEGRLLTLGVTIKTRPVFFGVFKTKVERVIVQLAETEAKHKAELRDALIKNLSYSNKEGVTVYNQIPLEKLIQKFVELRGFV